MRISDWSSDGCPSDLRIGLPTARGPGERALEGRRENDPASTKAGQLRFEAIESSGDRDALRRLVRLAVILLAELCLAASPCARPTGRPVQRIGQVFRHWLDPLKPRRVEAGTAMRSRVRGLRVVLGRR